jgi:diguanylate cyclase (GGDEF)-like protein
MVADSEWSDRVRAPGRDAAGVISRGVKLIRSDGTVAIGLVVSLLGLWLFAFGPHDGQRVGIRMVAPTFAGMLAIGQWRIGRDRRQSRSSMRFWRILAVAMFIYTAGMLVDLLSFVFALPVLDAGETFLYPVAGICTVVALIVFPTTSQSGAERFRMVLDVVTVLLGSATFVWYFLVSLRWRPENGWHELSDGLIHPGLALVAGFVILRITMIGANVIGRTTTACFVFGALSATGPIIAGAQSDTPVGRAGSVVHVIGFMTCVVGVAIQLRDGPNPAGGPADRGQPRWRRFLVVLPYSTVIATLVLLLIVIRTGLNPRGWGVVIGAFGLCVLLIVRQLASLWENSRLLRANRELTERLRHQAFHDQLTGLANRTLFTDQVTAALARARHDSGTVAVMFVDLDDFKLVNDSMGHQVGDELLLAVAQRLRGAVPAEGCLGRLGGDEFAILVPGSVVGAGIGLSAGSAVGIGVRGIAERIVDVLSLPFHVSGMPVNVSASVGIAAAVGGAPGTAELLRNADVAMYSAKNAHKGGWRVFEPMMLATVLRRHRLQGALADAWARGEFVVYYQPIIDLFDGTVHGAEALVRWRQPDGRCTLPGQFIPLAEETGLVTRIDRWVLNQACRQARSWWGIPAAGRPFALHVNLSARHLHRPDLVHDVAEALHESDLPADQLTLEITESGLGHNHEAAIERLGELGRLGVHLAIDDFGTGYSSLAYLQRMPVDVLKIDKTFTDELSLGAPPAPLVQAVIALAAALGMQTVAEGIEGPAQAQRLLALGCRYGQGFHYAEPLSADQMEDFLRQ